MEIGLRRSQHLRTFICTSSINAVDKSRMSAANYPKLGSFTRAAFTSVINFLGWWDNYERNFYVFGNLDATYWHDSLSLHQRQRRLSVGCLLFWKKNASPIKPNHTTKCVRPCYECRHCTSTFPLHNTWPSGQVLCRVLCTPSVALYRNCKCYNLAPRKMLEMSQKLQLTDPCLSYMSRDTTTTTTTTTPNVKVPPMSYVMQFY
jgi:hypothetical protein